jgi:hypothetical protein
LDLDRLAGTLLVLAMTVMLLPSYGRPSLLTTARLLIWHTLLAFTLIRFGVLATVCCALHGLYHRGISTNHELVGLVRAGGPTRNRHINCTGTLRVCDNSMGPGALGGETGRLLEPATMAEDSHTITRLSLDWRSGNKDAAARLMVAYRELHQMASRQMRIERGEHTLQTTALVHEAYIRLWGAAPLQRHDRAIFSRSRPNSYVVFWLIMRGASAAKNAAVARCVRLCSMRTTRSGSLMNDCWLSMELYGSSKHWIGAPA